MRKRIGMSLASQAISLGGSIAGMCAALIVNRLTRGWNLTIEWELARIGIELLAFVVTQIILFLITGDGLMRTVLCARDRLGETLGSRMKTRGWSKAVEPSAADPVTISNRDLSRNLP